MDFASVAPFSTTIYNISKDIVNFVRSKKTITSIDSERKLQKHIIDIDNWSSRVQFVGMAKSMDTDVHTSSVRISSSPRRFFNKKDEVSINEIDIVNLLGDVVVLGDPGSGKTTAVKRIVRDVIHNDQSSCEIRVDFPILILARELKNGEGLIEKLCNIIGINSYLPDLPKVHAMQKGYQAVISEYTNMLKHYNPHRDYLDVVDEFLSDRNFLIIVDGLDEAPEGSRELVESDLQQLSRRLSTGKIICTCRSGDYFRDLDGFDVFEVMPLTYTEQSDIVSKWSESPELFLDQISKKAYSDLVTKPLYLCQLILVFNEYGSLPESASDIYRQIIYLMMERWDRSRGINRPTLYSKFSIEKRVHFFAKMSLELYKRYGGGAFSDQELLPIYYDIRKIFGLPREGARDVIREMESHYGIVVQASHNKYDFSHLSIREYFAALDIVMQGNVQRAVELLVSFPHVVALSTCLSTDAGYYLAEILLHFDHSHPPQNYERVISTFLNRLIIERPNFGESAHLGVAILILVSDLVENLSWGKSVSIEKSVSSLIEFDGIRESVTLALSHYEFRTDGEQYEFILREGVYGYDESFPKHIIISSRGVPFLDTLKLSWVIDI